MKDVDLNVLYEGETPLTMCVKMESFATFKLLLEKGANPNREALSGMTPLIMAMNDHKNAMVDTLLEYDIDYDLQLNKSAGSILLHKINFTHLLMCIRRGAIIYKSPLLYWTKQQLGDNYY